MTETLEIGELLGSGAWADVHAVRGRPDLVAKIARERHDTELADGADHWWIVTTIRLDDTMPPSEILEAEASYLAHVPGDAFARLHRQGRVLINGTLRTVLFLERLYGATARELCEAGRVDRVLAALPELVLRLDELAGQNRFHGDIKPDNVWIDTDRRIRLIDPSGGFWSRLRVHVLLTPTRNPSFVASDVPALAFMLVEMISRARPSPPRRHRARRSNAYRPFREHDRGYGTGNDPDPVALFHDWLSTRELPPDRAGRALVDTCLGCMGLDGEPPHLAHIADRLIRELDAAIASRG